VLTPCPPLLPEPPDTAPLTGFSRLRAIHLSPQDVRSTLAITVDGQPTTMSGLRYGCLSRHGVIPNGHHQLDVYIEGPSGREHRFTDSTWLDDEYRTYIWIDEDPETRRLTGGVGSQTEESMSPRLHMKPRKEGWAQVRFFDAIVGLGKYDLWNFWWAEDTASATEEPVAARWRFGTPGVTLNMIGGDVGAAEIPIARPLRMRLNIYELRVERGDLTVRLPVEDYTKTTYSVPIAPLKEVAYTAFLTGRVGSYDIPLELILCPNTSAAAETGCQRRRLTP
jgi:hypothetical protein